METVGVLKSSHRLFANLNRQTSVFRHCGVLETQKWDTGGRKRRAKWKDGGENAEKTVNK